MKKFTSLLLTLAMMLSMVPAVSAVEADATAEPEIAVEEVVSKEDLDRQIEADQLADAAKLTDEEIAAREEDRRARVEAVLAAAEISEDPIQDGVQAMPEPAALGASTNDDEYTINVTLYFTSAATKDTTIRIDCFDNEGYFGSYYDVDNQTLPKGGDNLNFKITVGKGSYNLEFYGVGSSTGWMYADIYGALSNDWDNRLYIGVFGDDKTIDVVINGDQLLKTVEEEEEVVGTDVKVTVNLPAKAVDGSEYYTFLRSGNSTQTAWESPSSGKSSYSETFNTTFSTFVVGYYDATDIYSTYNVRYAAGARYIAEDGGITTQFSEAKVFTASETSAVTIEDTSNYAMTGKLKLESARTYDKGMYAFAEFEDGECYAGRAFFPAGETSANYTIYIPKDKANSTFTHWAAETRNDNSNRILDDSYLEGGEYTLTKSGSLSDITLPDPPVTVSGTFSLPDGMKAPTGGLNVAICIEDASEVYTLAADESSFDFELTPLIDEDEEYNVYAYIEDAPDNLCDGFYNRYLGSELLGIDMTAYETVVISGSLESPEECEEKGSTIWLYSYTNVDDDHRFYDHLYVTILPGQTTAAYEIKALKGYENTRFYAEVEADATGKLLSTTLYLQEDGTVSENYTNLTLTKDMSDVDFVYGLGKSISGKITLDEGLSGGYYSGTVYARPTEGGDTYRTYFYFDGTEGSYSLAVPTDYTGTYRVYFYIYSEDEPNALTDCQIYYTESGMTTDYSSASKISVPDTGVENIDLVILKAKFITGTITAPAGMPASAYYSGCVYAENTETNADYSSWFGFNGTQYTYSLGIPADETGPLYVSIYMYDESAEGVMIGEHCYWSDSGMVFNRDNATAITPSETGATVDMTIPKGLVASGNITIPSTLPADGDYYGRVYLVDENDNSYDSYFNFSDGRTSYSISLPADYTGTYNLYIYVYQSDETPEGLITYTNLYLQEDGTFSTSKDTAKDFTIGEAGLTQDIEIPVGQSFTVNMAAPAGFSGDYSGYIYLYNVTAGTNTGKNFEFSGTSGSVSFTVPSGDTSEYALRINVYEGPGAMYNTYYYAEGGKWVSSQSNRTTFTTESGSLDITLPAGKVIRGVLKSADGSEPDLGTNDDGYYGNIYLNAVTGSYISGNSTVNADGTFTLTIPEDSTGTHRLYFSPRSNPGCNVVSNSYYYVEGSNASVTDYSNATAIDVSGEIPELTIYVDTGWVLSGTVELGEGATLSGTSNYNDGRLADVNMYLRENVDTNASYSSVYVYLYEDETSWNYTLVVPKKETSYTLTARNFDTTSDSIVSNIYDGDMIVSDSVSVSASQTTLPTATLLPAKTTISVKITNPASSTAYGTAYVKAGENSYYQSIDIGAGLTDTLEIKISPTETAETYTVSYYVYSPDSLYRYIDIYVVEDNELTLLDTEAGSFGWNKTSVEFTLMEIPPYATGKIYLPECTDDTSFSIRLYGYSSYTTFEVNSNTIQTDADGNQYIPYELSNRYATPGNTYLLGYCLDNYDGTELYYKGTSSSYRAYVTATGEVIYQYDYNNAFTIPESGTNVLDFTLATWDDGSEENIFQSMHGIPSYTDMPTYTYTYPGAVRLQVTFSERTDTNLTINGDTYYYSNLNYGSPVTIDVSDTNGVMTITGYNGTGRSVYGFGITKIVPEYASYPTAPAVASVYTDNGSTDEIVMNDLRSGETVRVSLAGPADASGTLFAAIYDSTGKMLDVSMENVTFSNGCAASTLDFDSVEGAAKLNIMLVNNTSGLAPQMAAKTITG